MGKIIALVLGSLVLVIALFGISIGLYIRSTYNGLVEKSQAIDAQWAQVETQYQRRFDLIPNLVEATKGIFEQEKTVFGQLADARSRYSGATSPDQRAEAATQVESALARLLVIVENYPNLSSQKNVTQLMDELAGTENRISVERQRFNERVLVYNNTVKRFPSNMIASWFDYEQRAYFRAVSGADGAPKVQF
ncbi:MAG: lema protein, LemA protein [Dehalococcoidia bacterium]|nr:lema protein, LemA protein [Dehalococcoidia bacterium]